MLIFPLNTETFKKLFLSADGQIELQSDQDMWLMLIATGGKFLPNIARVAGVTFKLSKEEHFRFGRKGGMRLSVGEGAAHEIRLIWPDEDDETLKALGLSEFLTDEKLYARLFFSANGDLAAVAEVQIRNIPRLVHQRRAEEGQPIIVRHSLSEHALQDRKELRRHPGKTRRGAGPRVEREKADSAGRVERSRARIRRNGRRSGQMARERLLRHLRQGCRSGAEKSPAG
jgi:hypothetical protein